MSFPWLIVGHMSIGLTVGVVTGLSKSPVAGVLLPLLFAFAGGSVLALTAVDGITTQYHDLLGKQLTAFALPTLVGVFIGIACQKRKIELPVSWS
jgi:hypothetical protein